MADVESVKETCPCGATFETSGYHSYVDARLIEWRINHKHERPAIVVRTQTTAAPE